MSPEGLFSCRPLSKTGTNLRHPRPPQSLNDSDDLEQDRPWAQLGRCVILENERPKMMKHAAAKSMTIVKLFSDNCVGHFKNR